MNIGDSVFCFTCTPERTNRSKRHNNNALTDCGIAAFSTLLPLPRRGDEKSGRKILNAHTRFRNKRD
jgi:hypothetical protein